MARTGLTRSAIRSHVGELAAGGPRDRGAAGAAGHTRAARRPSSRSIASASSVLALEIAVDSLAVAHVGPAGEVIELRRVDRPRGHITVDAGRGRPGRPSSVACARDRSSRQRLVGIGVAVAGVVRRADGLVRTAPNLGWRDVALVERLARCPRHDRARRPSPTRPTSAPWRNPGAAPRAVPTTSSTSRVRSASAAASSSTAGRSTGVAGYGGEIGHMPGQSRRAPPAAAASTGCWETEVGEDALLRLAGRPPAAGGRPWTRCCAAADGRRPDRAGGHRSRRPLARRRPGRPRQHLQPAAHRPRRPLRAARAVRRRDRRGRARPSRPGGAARPRPGRCRPTLGEDAPLLGAAELAFEPLLDDPAAWLGPRSGAAARCGAHERAAATARPPGRAAHRVSPGAEGGSLASVTREIGVTLSASQYARSQTEEEKQA